jgi:hypothetical protein
MRHVRVFVVCAAVLGALLGSTPARAEIDVAACPASAIMNYVGGVTYAGVMHFECLVVGTGDDGGSWDFNFTVNTTVSACPAAVVGNGGIGSGVTANDGSITGGSFDYVQVGVNIVLVGNIKTSADTPSHPFAATLVAVPSCTNMNLSGLAVLTDGQTIPRPPPINIDNDAAPCTINVNEAYGPGLPLGNVGPIPAAIAVNANCVGVTDDAGPWLFGGNGTVTNVSCAAESGNASGTGGNAGGNGTISSWSATWGRMGVTTVFVATISAGGKTHRLAGVLAWAPSGICPTFAATMTGPGGVATT